MKITIKSEKNSSITKDIPFELGGYTILAGENNAGKTSIVRAIKAHKDLKSYKKIYIQAEDVNPGTTDVAKTSVKTSGFYKLLEELLKPIINAEKILQELKDEFDKSSEKKNFIETINKFLQELGVEDKKFNIKLSIEEFGEAIIIKTLIKTFAEDQYKTDIKEVDFDKIGMGTKRLIVSTLIRYYEEKGIGKDENTLIIFEEPEIYLHPKLKSSLYKALLKLSQRKNTEVLITTHDPYFIELGKSQKIYRVYRDSKNKDATAVDEMKGAEYLQYKSDAEINYIVFDIPSKTYFLELYENLISFFDATGATCDECGKSEESKYNAVNKWIATQNKDSKVSKLRHKIAHSKGEVDMEDEEIYKGIKELRVFISTLISESESASEKEEIDSVESDEEGDAAESK